MEKNQNYKEPSKQPSEEEKTAAFNRMNLLFQSILGVQAQENEEENQEQDEETQ